jgi:TolB-like protein
MRLFVEIQRRGLLKLATGYLIVSWLVLEVGHTLFYVFELPHAGLQFVFVLLALGFPLVLLGAWQGWFGSSVRSGPHAPQEAGSAHASISHHEGPWLAAVFGAVALFAIAVAIGVRFFGMGHSVSRVEHESSAATVTSPPTSAKATTDPSLPTAASVSDKSIAVLPFTDMSEKKDQEYFADGMAEEVIDILVKIPGLDVIGRTSSFQFKGKGEDLRTIGARLGAAFVVEGSIRMAGPRVRVTAQLIDTRSGAHRWSESYDRDIGDILALQSEIGTGIARSLQLMVDADVRPPPQLPNAEAYTLYLHGLELRDQQHLDQLVEAVREFEQALALDPSFLRAAEALALTDVALGFDEDLVAHDAWQHARENAKAALRIDPNSAPAHGVLGLVHAEDEYVRCYRCGTPAMKYLQRAVRP